MGGPAFRCPNRADFLYSPEGAFTCFARCDFSHLDYSDDVVSAFLLGFNLQVGIIHIRTGVYLYPVFHSDSDCSCVSDRMACVEVVDENAERLAFSRNSCDFVYHHPKINDTIH
jgi:hypothetical protein